MNQFRNEGLIHYSRLGMTIDRTKLYMRLTVR